MEKDWMKVRGDEVKEEEKDTRDTLGGNKEVQ